MLMAKINGCILTLLPVLNTDLMAIFIIHERNILGMRKRTPLKFNRCAHIQHGCIVQKQRGIVIQPGKFIKFHGY